MGDSEGEPFLSEKLITIERGGGGGGCVAAVDLLSRSPINSSLSAFSASPRSASAFISSSFHFTSTPYVFSSLFLRKLALLLFHLSDSLCIHSFEMRVDCPV